MKENNGQAFIFVPRTRDVQKVMNWIIQHGGVEKDRVAGVYSQDPKRKEKVQQMRTGEIRVLVTTTILERGVTVPRCSVLVWGADHPVFDQASLVQIAGRVGRSKDYQNGEVWFLGSERTESQRKAKKEICWLNEQAKKEGYLEKGAYIP
jgi:competence protein ComFA